MSDSRCSYQNSNHSPRMNPLSMISPPVDAFRNSPTYPQQNRASFISPAPQKHELLDPSQQVSGALISPHNFRIAEPSSTPKPIKSSEHSLCMSLNVPDDLCAFENEGNLNEGESYSRIIRPLLYSTTTKGEPVLSLPISPHQTNSFVQTHLFTSLLSQQGYQPLPLTVQSIVEEIRRVKSFSEDDVHFLTSLPSFVSDSSFIGIRVCHDQIQLWKAAISGPVDTPYKNGVFEFDMFIPSEYPKFPPSVACVSTHNGKISISRFISCSGSISLPHLCNSLENTDKSDCNFPALSPSHSIASESASSSSLSVSSLSPVSSETEHSAQPSSFTFVPAQSATSSDSKRSQQNPLPKSSKEQITSSAVWNSHCPSIIQLLATIRNAVFAKEPILSSSSASAMSDDDDDGIRGDADGVSQVSVEKIVQCGIIDSIQRALNKETPFSQLIKTHFRLKKNEIREQLQSYLDKGQVSLLMFTEASNLLNKL
ncbi:putative Ubiquitin-conjugating enzyme [Monocercomonoides exilis]|uniref:putative Ubiquitin-conjugating enzyme n=1 Tax=Monocercomonoides exilis TaxID=2049356 RepID=UPI00355A64FC|nr:putative Ubiquitin-conjugating enzyme [Monocercomonoides exilis]|eukprot:MONOS_10621.1-p1 / transcript=MONOS_10621.1 / gene=MONOS_10621 / organism=Monocercomonoides_exilis_PA203 / gene_product=unspecified product / transcript_product=unspecified product / location=Mono_scaffold00490:27992-29639(-) / protein_length=482 / sequence_SO=supercontig / SO=protein_coding / is_pseudo=false